MNRKQAVKGTVEQGHSTAKHNPYKLYHKWWDMGWHRKKIVEYGDLDSILFHIMQMKYPKVSWDLTA